MCKCRAEEGSPAFMKSVYHNSIFSHMVNPHLFMNFAFLYLNGMEQNKNEEALNLGHSRGVAWKKMIQKISREIKTR
jgi:hypothetical protein